MYKTFVAVVALVLMMGCGERRGAERTRSASRQKPALAQPAAADSHQQMLELLRQVQEQAHREINDYYSDAAAQELRTALASLPADAPLIERFRLTAALGYRELLFGHTEQSIEHFAAALQLVPEVEDQLGEEYSPQSLPLLLGVAHLRQAETENCVLGHNAESCLFPISASGTHVRQQGARGAIRWFSEVLERDPDHLRARWLLNLAYMLVGEHPNAVPQHLLIPAETFQSEESFPRFKDVATDLGVNTFSHCGGAVVDDFDNDGWLDIVVSSWNPSAQLRYFQNPGDGTFRERTAEAGLTGIFGGLNLVQADYDNDGDVDILVLRGAWLDQQGRHPNSLLQNDGRGRFRDVTFAVGLGDVHYPTQTAGWADFDNDGDLDLYIGNEGFPSQLFKNDGRGRFQDIALEAGVENGRRAKGVAWGDFNNDRLPDLYVSNQGQPNRLYRNNGDGTFKDVALLAGVFNPIRGFPTWFWDFNNDGALDIYAASYGPLVEHIAADYLGIPQDSEPDCLYQGDGTGRFREVARELGLGRPTAPMGSNFGDLDHDGFPDFYLGTGYPEYEQLMPNLMFRNRGGNGFANVTTAGGFGNLQKGHAVAFADFDHDGDQDIFIEMGGAFAGDAFWDSLFENPGFGNHWLTLKLIGKQSNRCGIGARIRLEVDEDGARRNIYKWVNSGGSFGGNPLRQQLGLGRADRIAVLEVFWPTTNQTDRFLDVAADQFLEITEGASQVRQLPWSAFQFRSPEK